MNKKTFLQLLCSEDENKIEQALVQLENDQDLKDFANTWFLNLIRTRLNDAKATLEDFTKVGFSKNDYMSFYMDNFNTEWFDFFQTPAQTLRSVVDFYGSITANFFDKNNYLEAISNVHSQDDLYSLDLKSGAAVKKAFLDVRQHCNTSKGSMTWFDYMIQVPYDTGLWGLKFEGCDLSKMNDSSYIDEFYFYVLAQAYDDIQIHHNNSSGPCYFPQLLWGAKAGISLHGFKGVIVKIPDNPLKVFNSWTLTYDLKDGGEEKHEFYDPNWKTYFSLRKKGNEFYKEKRYSEAIEIYKQAANIRETKEIYKLIFQCEIHLKLDLIPTYEKIVKIDSRDVHILNNLAFEYNKIDRLKEAMDIIEKATNPKFKSNENYGIAWATKAEICYKIGNEEALFEALNNCQLFGFDPLQCDPEIQKRYQNDPRYRAILDERD